MYILIIIYFITSLFRKCSTFNIHDFMNNKIIVVI